MIELFLRTEIERLGYVVRDDVPTAVEVEGSFSDAMRLNLQLRTALAVLLRLDDFPCRNPEQLYRRINNWPWEELIAPDSYLTVQSSVDHPSVNNSMFPNLKVKDAIVDRIKARTGARPNSGSSRDGVVINVFWKKEHCWVYLNTSGRRLADRSYRRMPHTAPMQETLAAAVLIAAGYDGAQPLVNPMCGSGTIAIEAALMAAHRAPGLLRANYSLMHTKWFDEDEWKSIRRDAQKQTVRNVPSPIIASDHDPRAIDAARRNAQTAGVQHLIEFQTCDFAATSLPDDDGFVILNPEYGRRLGDERALEDTYAAIGDFFKQRCAGRTGAIFTGNLDLAKRVGLKPRRRIPFMSADLECRLILYEMYEGSRREDR